MQRILIINLKSLPSWHIDLQEAFQQIGIDARLFLTQPQTVRETWEKRTHKLKWFKSPASLKRLQETCMSFHPDFILFLGMFVLPRKAVETILSCLKYRPILAGWVCDCFTKPQFDNWVSADHVFYFDTFLETVLPEFYPKPSQTTYLPLASNPHRYHPIQSGKKPRLLFAGNVSPDRRTLLEQIKHKIPLDLFGPNASLKGFNRRKKLTSRELNLLYNQYAAVLNINQKPNTVNGLNLRCFEVTAAGGLLITQNCPDLQLCFKPGKEVLTYQSPDEIPDIFQKILDNPQKAELIAQTGYNRCLRDHSFLNRVENIKTFGKQPENES